MYYDFSQGGIDTESIQKFTKSLGPAVDENCSSLRKNPIFGGIWENLPNHQKIQPSLIELKLSMAGQAK